MCPELLLFGNGINFALIFILVNFNSGLKRDFVHIFKYEKVEKSRSAFEDVRAANVTHLETSRIDIECPFY